MLKIAHRINTLKELNKLDKNLGVELDIRAEGDRLILHHDPFTPGTDFESYLKEYNHGLMVLNTKCEGMEEKIIELMKKYKIRDYFFLDLSLPFLIKYANRGVKDIAVRFSEYEPLEFVMKFKGKVNWLWIDCFTEFPLKKENYNILKENFKLCLVSPELQGYSVEKIEDFKKLIKGMKIDAVCTKRPDLWEC
jgi:hypothetical protein